MYSIKKIMLSKFVTLLIGVNIYFLDYLLILKILLFWNESGSSMTLFIFKILKTWQIV